MTQSGPADPEQRQARGHVLVIKNVSVIPGNGQTRIPGCTLVIRDGVIEDILKGGGKASPSGRGIQVVDGTGTIAIPGLVNIHAHAVGFGPRLCGQTPYPANHVVLQLHRHLAYGTTTVLNVDGFQLPREVEAVMDHAPIRVKACSLHTPSNFRVARLWPVDYALREEHEALTAEQAVAAGAVAIGQVGLGLALGVMWYELIPREVARVTGRTLEPQQARRLFEGVVGREVNREAYAREAVDAVIRELELSDVLKASQVRDIVQAIALPAQKGTIDSISESADVARKLGVPVLISNNVATKRALQEVSRELGPKLIALHSNHPSLTAQEAVDQARALRANGSYVDITTGDFLGVRRIVADGEVTAALLREGLVDVISTDYIGGYFEPILRLLEWTVAERLMSLEEAIVLCTKRAVDAVPRLAPNAGELAPGRIADVALVREHSIVQVVAVVKEGRVVFGPFK